MISEMMGVYRAFVLVNAVVATLLVLVGLRVVASISAPFPSGFVRYYPVFFGLFGVVGLWRVVAGPSPPAGIRARNDIVFLTAGILGAALTTFAAQRYLSPLSGGEWIGFLIGFLLFLSGPVVIAILEIRRRVPALSSDRANGQARAAFVIAILLLLPVAAALSRVAAKQALTAWYARDFPANASDSAARITDGRPYRIDVQGHPPGTSFDDVDKDALLDRAFENHFMIGGLNGLWIEPHITLHVGDDRYFWSFRKGKFYR